MKKSMRFLIIFLITFFCFSNLCFATNVNTEDSLITANDLNQDMMLISEGRENNSNEINSDVFITQENVNVTESVNGSLYLVGDNIRVSSPKVNGNIFAIGNEIKIDGNVEGCVYVISNEIEVSGKINDLYLITDELEVLGNAICRDIKMIGNKIEIFGTVTRDLYAFSSNIDIKDGENTKIGGIISTTGNVTGRTDKANEISKVDIKIEKNDAFLNAFAKTVRTFYFISTAVMAFVIIGIFVLCSKKSDVYKSEVKEMFLKDTLNGLVYWMICILITIVLMITILGIPFAILFASIIWLLFWKINLPVASIEISKFVLKDNANSKWMILAVAFAIFIVVQLIAIIPVLGTLAKYIISLYGFGFMYRKIFKREKETKIEATIINE